MVFFQIFNSPEKPFGPRDFIITKDFSYTFNFFYSYRTIQVIYFMLSEIQKFVVVMD